MTELGTMGLVAGWSWFVWFRTG